MKIIKLSNGFPVIVDDEDFEYLNQFNWQCVPSKKTYYAKRDVYVGKGKHARYQAMHREILRLKSGDGKVTDHINRHGWDNRKENLRICTQQENVKNRRPSQRGHPEYLGVSWREERQIWRATIGVDGKQIYLGQFKTADEAAAAYNRGALKYHKDFANFNIIKGEILFHISDEDYTPVHLFRTNKSGFRGVSKHKQCDRWVVRFTIKGVKYDLGLFKTKEDGARAYNTKVTEVLGDEAILNIIPDDIQEIQKEKEAA